MHLHWWRMAARSTIKGIQMRKVLIAMFAQVTVPDYVRLMNGKHIP